MSSSYCIASSGIWWPIKSFTCLSRFQYSLCVLSSSADMTQRFDFLSSGDPSCQFFTSISFHWSDHMLEQIPVESPHQSEQRNHLLCLSLECPESHVTKRVALGSRNFFHILSQHPEKSSIRLIMTSIQERIQIPTHSTALLVIFESTSQVFQPTFCHTCHADKDSVCNVGANAIYEGRFSREKIYNTWNNALIYRQRECSGHASNSRYRCAHLQYIIECISIGESRCCDAIEVFQVVPSRKLCHSGKGVSTKIKTSG